ncbi:MAG: purine-nucleoside phosphorylase [Ignavibacteriota bacterium]|nr:purine-nucleoside phosphorylase [Ignavibacteriota bacterium]
MNKEHKEAYKYIKGVTDKKYDTGIILGTGLGGLVKFIEKEHSIDYKDIPGFPVSTVESHTGKLIFGKLSGKNIIAMSGRFHYYEGYNHQRVTFPIHIFKQAGIKNLIVSNACGAVSTKLEKADLMIITSHFNMHFATPLIGDFKRNGSASKYFYDADLIALAEKVALKNNINIKKGSYASVQGPNLETKAEYRLMQKIGVDTVGMSTIPEVLVARELGIRTLGLSIITDLGFPDTLRVAMLEDILESAAKAEPKMVTLIKKLVNEL